jgi:iron(III) transport system ATP-binding protein
MIELAVDDLHLTYGDNPVFKRGLHEPEARRSGLLLGPSGSGKTTLLRAVAGWKTDQGRLSLAKQSLRRHAAQRGPGGRA